MKAIILAGGKGTRLQSVISKLPKPMSPIAGKPFLEYLLLQLKTFSLNDVVLSVGYKKEDVISYFSDGSKLGLNIIYSPEDVPLGTGGAIQKAIKFIREEYFLVLNGDSYIDIDLSQFINWFFQKERIAAIVVTKMDNTGRYGTIEIDEKDRINKFMEKTETVGHNWINAGVYLLNRSVFQNIFSRKSYSLEKDILPNLIEIGLYGYKCQGAFIDIGTPESYNQADLFFSNIKKRL